MLLSVKSDILFVCLFNLSIFNSFQVNIVKSDSSHYILIIKSNWSNEIINILILLMISRNSESKLLYNT